ncbi:hypothetical protein [Clostridium paraputrificum]|uniref:hypothetical protein n=1 Tax=Clostridium paraputrificum TaxID=29363 RepID=UPI00189F8F90|nr:hypothetical protein [Clostridium paraputrificum]
MIYYKVLVDNKYFKQIRIIDGVLTNIYKCSFKNDISSYIKNPRKQLKKIDDVLYETKEDMVNKYTDEIYYRGTILYKKYCSYYPIDVLLPKYKWSWEIKTTGECFSGDTEYFKQLVNTVLDIIDKESY